MIFRELQVFFLFLRKKRLVLSLKKGPESPYMLIFGGFLTDEIFS